MSNPGDEHATSEPDPPDGKPDGEQSPQESGVPRQKRKKRPHLRTLARALFFAARVLWWWLYDD